MIEISKIISTVFLTSAILITIGRSHPLKAQELITPYPFWSDYAIAVTEHGSAENGLNFNHMAEGILVQTAFLLKIGIECFALLILAVGIIKAVIKLLAVRKKLDRPKVLCAVRLDLGLSLVLSLEFLLAADIAATAISPSWDAIGKLAAISGIRTFLNFFLQKEVQELENHNNKI